MANRMSEYQERSLGYSEDGGAGPETFGRTTGGAAGWVCCLAGWRCSGWEPGRGTNSARTFGAI